MNNFSLKQLKKKSVEQNKAIKFVLKNIPNNKNEIIVEPDAYRWEYFVDDNVLIANCLLINLKNVAYAHLIPSEKEREESEEIYTTSKKRRLIL